MKNFVHAVVNNDVVRRAVKTFVQAFVATLIVSWASVHDANSAKAVAVAAVAAAVSATWNFLKQTV
jgi:hypothetical protein